MAVKFLEIVTRVAAGAIDQYSYEFQKKQELLEMKRRKRRRINFFINKHTNTTNLLGDIAKGVISIVSAVIGNSNKKE